jgi:pimeloyl-ACP methyl ester carboxylesterase
MVRANRVMFALAGRAPVVLRLSLATMGRTAFRSEASYAASMLRSLPPADRAVLSGRTDVRRVLFESTADGLRQGARGAAQEFTMFSRPWHFDLADIRVPVVLWHGTEDLNVPFTVAQEVSRRIPGSRLHVWEGEGHLALYAHLEEILDPVVEAGRPPHEDGVAPRSPDPAGADG